MGSANVLVVGAGMTSAVGLSAAETAASVRAGTMRFAPIPILDRQLEQFAMACVPDEALPELTAPLAELRLTNQERRVVRLAATALADCHRTLPTSAGVPGLFVALPAFVGRSNDDVTMVRALALQAGCTLDLSRSGPPFRGRAGGLAAIEAAARAIREGRAHVAIAGGVDSYRDPVVLTKLDSRKRVKSSNNLDGFIPGEGAAFVALASVAAARALDLQPLAALSSIGEGFEEGHFTSETPYRGNGLAQAIAALLGRGEIHGPFETVYSSMNGESYWAKEWGVSVIRHRAAFAPTAEIHHPADCLGDVGAAYGPLAVGLAALAINGRYRRAPCLVYASSDDGHRAAIAVSST